jgi:hypothetical protein
LVTPFLGDAEVKEEASAATVSIAEEILRRQNASSLAPRLIEPLEKVGQATANDDLAKRAKNLLDRARKRVANP